MWSTDAGPTSRRDFLRAGLAGLAVSPLLGCHSLGPEAERRPTDPRLSARPGTPSLAAPVGESPLGLGGGRDGLLYVPAAYDPDVLWPLVVGLHGSGGSAAAWTSWYDVAEARGFVFLAIDSRGSTWDLVNGYFGRDVEFVDAALAHTFERCAIDPGLVSVVGYSNGASYGLSLGVLNGDLFTHLVGLAAGFFLPLGDRVGKPLVYLGHGIQDPVAPVTASRQIASTLRAEGYDVTLREFPGDHTIPPAEARAALDWLF